MTALIPMSTIPTVILGLVLLSLLGKFYILPLLFSHLSGLQINRLSFLSLRGLEYRIGDDAHSVIPTLRLERAAWAWGGWKEDGVKGLIVLRLEGVSFRVKKRLKKDKPKPVEPRPKAPPGRVVYWRNRSLSYILQILIHHWPSLARIVSVQVGDIRLIFDDLDGIELTVRDVHMGVKVIFEGAAEPSEVTVSSPAMSHSSTQDSGRAYPLASPTPDSGPTSPFLSPPAFFNSFSFPLPPDPNAARPSRIEAARRRASRMSSTAVGIWSRAIARARGQVIFMTNITDISLILPHHSDGSKRCADPELAPTSHPHLNGLSHQASSKSLSSEAKKERSRSFVNPVRSLLTSSPPRYALPSEGGYERLLVVDDISSASLALGFGPKKGLLGEDTLRTSLSWGRIRTSLEATDRIKEIVKHHSASDQPKKESSPKWSPQGMPRIILRAFESVSFSFAHFTVSHYLPASEHTARSAASSTTDISDLLIVDDDVFTISLEVDQLYCQLDAADSSTNQRTRNAFGTNSNPESKVRGIGIKLAWTSIGVQCIAPGEDVLQKSQLFQMRSAEFEGCSTWRPGGWSREELLFANDPNLALLVGRGGIQSVDVAADLPLLYDLKQAWQRSRPEKPPVATPTTPAPPSGSLPPRVRMVLDVGPVMVLVADPTSDNNTTLTVASDGLHIGCFTSFSDIVARRNRTATKAAFKAEEELRSRREQSGTDEDYSQPAPMLKPQYRRHFSQAPAKLRDDYAISMRADASLEMEPLSLHMTLSGESSDNQTHHLASIGRMHTTLGGDIWGKQEVLADGTELCRLVPDSRSFAFDLGIDQGIKVDLWESEVIDALAIMASVHRPPPQTQPARSTSSILAKLPTGLSVRLSLGLISVFIGHPDPNPECKLHLVRGIWIQTQATLEYSYYGNSVQAMTCRHPLASASRSKLRLPEDIKTQALAHYNELSGADGRAALFAVSLADTFVKPIFHGERFVQAGGIYLSHEVPKSPKQRQGDDFVGWEFLRPKVEADLSQGKFANNLAPLEESETEQAARPLLRIPQCSLVFIMRSENPEAEVGYDLSGDVDGIEIVGDLSHIYCTLLASLVIRRLASAAKHPKPATEKAKSPSRLSINVSITHVNVHLVYPAGEHMVLYVKVVKVFKHAGEALHTRVEIILMYVPSPRELGAFEELARLQGLDLSVDTTGPKPVFHIDAEALRLRIPFGYIFAKLVLNIQLAVKSVKLLVLDLGKVAEFLFIRRPAAEDPKHIPKLLFNIRYISLEAKDNPIETRLNLIWRVGINEQSNRNGWEDTFERKQQVLEEPSVISLDEEVLPGRHPYKLSKNATVSYEEARYRLDWFKAQEWRKRIDKAIKTQRLREHDALKNMENIGPDRKLPIRIAAATQSAPLFRAAFENVAMTVKSLDWSTEGLIKYMGDVSAPFDEGTEFSLFIPLHLTWTMTSGSFKLRDYPLDLIKVPIGDDGPSWHLETPFIIAEELQGPDSVVYIPSQVLPGHLGAKDAAPFVVQISKTIMPVKTYARPIINISSSRVTEFTWGNSYSPAISDVTRVIDTLSHPPRDPSPKVGFWDKFRLILHWRVTMNFTGPVHLHLKGATDPYATTGFGAGFALAWTGGTRVEINQPNEQYETIQIIAEELLIAIPDLTGVHDGEAIGRDAASRPRERTHQDLIQRRYTKPCAQYQNGVRVGFGFVFEQTCRKWNCKNNCGSTENLLHRQCRIMQSKKHQQVILRSPEAKARDDKAAGHPTDSYEGFRSDWIHFSVSNVSPLNKVDPNEKDSNKTTGLFFSPKAFAHFFAWWKLFDSATSLPIRQGKLFPDSPPTSKKFGRSLGTIKYRFDLAPVYVSHVYTQVAPELWAKGKAQSLGVKARFGSFRADAHQRAQEKVVRHEKLHRTTIVTHKPFYAADLLLENIEFKGVKAEFHETTESGRATPTSDNPEICRVCELKPDRRIWFNFFDYIDADRKPLDRDPEMEIVDIGDCPQVFFSKRVKARQTTANDDDAESVTSSQDSRLELESTKFGHERSHVCYLGEASPVAPTQMRITRNRIKELEEMRVALSEEDSTYASDLRNINGRLNSLNKHVEDLSSKESRHIDDDTFQAAYIHPLEKEEHHHGDVNFENTFHVHCPRVVLTNTARNLLYKYYFSSRDRKREEYTTSHASLRGVREGITKRMQALNKGLFEDHVDESAAPEQDEGLDILQKLQEMLVGSNAVKRFEVRDHNMTGEEELRRRSIGIPEDCIVKPQNDFLILKPQIALRSNVDQDAIVLLAMEEVSFKGYRVMDQNFSDPVAANVLDRNYVAMKGLQAFYPSESTMRQERGPLGVPRGLDFLPLEILLDVRSEATDYDRIVLKTDAALYTDRFNHLRVPRGLDWPNVKDDEGYSMDHLRRHQDLFTIVVPRLSLAATSKHYTALYDVVTDLLIYTDPEHRQRSERIDAFIYAFDRKDRDPQRLILELFGLQQEIRQLTVLEKGYAANLDLLDETGKAELFKIRTDHLEGMEQLFTVFEAIAVNQARDDAKAALKTASRMDVRVGGLAWHMLRDDLTPLVKLDMEGTLYSMVSNKDGSTDNAAVFGEISMLNSDQDAMYPEVLARYEPSATRRGKRDSFASIFMSTMAPVGGIQIVRHLAVHLHPVRFKLEERLGHEIVDYVFNDRVKRRRQKAEDKQDGTNGHKHNGTSTPSNDSNRHLHMPGRREAARTPSGMEMPPLQRSKSQGSVLSEMAPRTSEDTGDSENKFTMVPIKDAAEMRRRASANKTFVKIVFANTSIVLSFKTDETKKHRTFSIPDCVDFKFKTPEIVYANKVWGYEDVFEHWKRDTRSYAWSQTGDLLSQLFKKTSVFRSKKTLKQIATLSPSDARPERSRIPSISSKLRYTVEPPTPQEEVQKTLALARALSREAQDPTHPISRPLSNGEGTSHVLGVPISSPPYDLSDEENDDSEKEEHGVHVGRTVKGLLGKLRSRTSMGHSRRDSGSFGSSDELSRISSSERLRKHSPSISSSSSSHFHHAS